MDTAFWTAFAVISGLTAVVVAKNFNTWYYEPKLESGQAPLPPGDMGWPIFGHMFAFVRAFKSVDPDSFIYNYVKRYGRIGLYKTHLFAQATILATTPETIKMVLMRDQKQFVSGWPKSTRGVMGSRSFACIEGEEHKQMRRLTAPSVKGTATLAGYVPKIEINAKRTLESWVNSGEVNLCRTCKKFTLTTIANIMISYQEGPDTEELIREFHGIVKGMRSFPLNLPGTAYYQALQYRRKLVKRFLEIINKRRTTGKKEVDVLQILMDNVDEETGATLTDMECVDTMLVYLVAGYETTAHTLIWYMILLNDHPDILNNVRDEFRGIHRTKKPGEPLTYTDCRNMHYLGKVLDEILRLVNIAPMVFRKVQSTTEINGFTIPKGWCVESWIRTVHLDPEVYSDPLSFNPDRWNDLKVKPGMFIPFGAGYRLCPGQDFAKMEVSVILYHITLFHDWKPLNSKYNITYLPHPHPTDGYPIKFTRRTGI